MNEKVEMIQVKYSLDSSYSYIDRNKFRLKITVFSQKNKKLYSQVFKDYFLDEYCDKKIYFQNINLFIPINFKILVNIKDFNGNETQRAIYFDEISNNNGCINL